MTDEARVSKEGLILIPSKHGIIISFANGLRSVNPRTVQRPKDKNSLSPFSVFPYTFTILWAPFPDLDKLLKTPHKRIQSYNNNYMVAINLEIGNNQRKT